MCALKVYLADLRHNFTGVISSDSMPLGMGFMKAVMDRDLPTVTSTIYAYPKDLIAALETDMPDVFMFTNYMWNEALGLHFAKLVKSKKSNCLVIAGGPNIPLEDERKITYLQQYPDIDLYVTGEGDFYATLLVQQFINCGLSIEKFLALNHHSSVYNYNGSGYICTKTEPRSRELDHIPSPYLTGIMDKFFDGQLVPIIETNRGCPFTCTFCVQGSKWYSHINNFGLDRLKAEIDYIGQMIKTRYPTQRVLRIADSNYGMYERDIEISGYIAESQKKYNYPLLIDATTGKNHAKRIIEAIEKVNGALVLYQAVQSLDDQVLNNIKRGGIKLEAYEQIQVHIKGRGLRSSSDLILALPGETIGTHLKALKQLIDSGTHNLNNFQAMLLKGSEFETEESRKKYAFKTKFRLLPKSFGHYAGTNIFDSEEIVVSSSTFSFADYLTARRYHFAVALFWNTSRFTSLANCLNTYGISSWDWINQVATEILLPQNELYSLFNEFLGETQDELFDTNEELNEFYNLPENFDKLKANKLGDNILYKYRGIASFMRWQTTCEVGFNAAYALLGQRGIFLDKVLWSEFSNFTCMGQAWGGTVQQLLSNAQQPFHYNIPAWIESNFALGAEDIKYPSPVGYHFFLPEENRKSFEAATKLWGYDIMSLSMLVKRTHNDWPKRNFTIGQFSDAILN